MSALEIKGLVKRFGSHTVIEGLSFEVPENCVYGFIGQNGAGKTTTMKMILGLLKPDEGSIRVFNEQVRYGQTDTNRYIGYLPDVPEFYNYMRPAEYLRLCGEITGCPSGSLKQKSGELLEMVGLKNVNKKIGGFSRGMKQRLGFAQALLNEPRLLLCDEPTSALDPVGRKEILDILENIKGKTTVIFSTHILSDVERVCDRIAVLDQGRLRLEGPLDEIKKKHRSGKLLAEFGTEKEAAGFEAMDFVKKTGADVRREGRKVILCSGNTREVQRAILCGLAGMDDMPLKIEVLEPSLENLFMEVVE
ncbi:ABC transporter ATP-binding protein [Murimonas intestini]|uniref:ABC transporter ATP-binding protein n=1 Tax=Murimonas intestini TaxID=1337051 RepID=UPI0011DE28BB|nr:ABC transporter ATP-binding protein [Murimonas intestini]